MKMVPRWLGIVLAIALVGGLIYALQPQPELVEVAQVEVKGICASCATEKRETKRKDRAAPRSFQSEGRLASVKAKRLDACLAM